MTCFIFQDGNYEKRAETFLKGLINDITFCKENVKKRKCSE